MDAIKKEKYDNNTISYVLNFEHLTCELATDTFKLIKSDILDNGNGVDEYILDVRLLKSADPLALSLFSAVKSLCMKLSKHFYMLGLSEDMNKVIIRHSSFKGKTPTAKRSGKFVVEHIVQIADFSIDIGKKVISTVGYIGEFTAALIDAIINPRKIRWRETFYYMDLCGADALPIVSMICFLMGLILAFQGAVQLSKVGTDIFLADAVGLSVIKELGPLMVAMISTGRAGSAFAAEIGTMKVGDEINAMTTFGFVPARFLFVPKFIAMIIVIPILTLFGDLIGTMGGMVVGYFKLEIPIVAYFNRTVKVIQLHHISESMTKSLVFAIIITITGCICGFESQNDAQGVGRSTTTAVVVSIFTIVIADAFLTYFFNQF
jgi:phospholipid/cholesterol/gamma-HCH transport system permease protein